MITSEDGKAVSAIVVCHGADSILTRIRVIDVTVTALGVERGNVLVYCRTQ